VGKERSKRGCGAGSAGGLGTSKSDPSGYLEYVADLLMELEEIAERNGNRELAERLRHSRQAAERL
jgi:hypothetical protein